MIPTTSEEYWIPAKDAERGVPQADPPIQWRQLPKHRGPTQHEVQKTLVEIVEGRHRFPVLEHRALLEHLPVREANYFLLDKSLGLLVLTRGCPIAAADSVGAWRAPARSVTAREVAAWLYKTGGAFTYSPVADNCQDVAEEFLRQVCGLSRDWEKVDAVCYLQSSELGRNPCPRYAPGFHMEHMGGKLYPANGVSSTRAPEAGSPLVLFGVSSGFIWGPSTPYSRGLWLPIEPIHEQEARERPGLRKRYWKSTQSLKFRQSSLCLWRHLAKCESYQHGFKFVSRHIYIPGGRKWTSRRFCLRL